MRYRVRTPEGELDYESLLHVEQAYIAGLVAPEDEVLEEGGTLWRKAASLPNLARAKRSKLLLGVLDCNFGFLHRLARLQIVLLSGDFAFPELLLAFVGRPSKGQPLLSGQQLAALFRYPGAGYDGKNLPLFDILTQIRLHLFDDTTEPWHDMGGAVLVVADFARERDHSADFG